MTTPAERFGASARALSGEPGVALSESRGFTRDSLMVRGKLFAAVRGEVLMLKLPAERVAALIATGDGAPFDANKGKPMKEWVLAAMSADWEALAREAAAFVAGASARGPRRPGTVAQTGRAPGVRG
ncbi:hypothetical protein [Phenylobacterium sp.]|uniref:hypothetical protein n=1 Tax=Phenylobacterium sp. TaxID=1871053 RepID=UPI001209A739|nr:hypothetical protein [Phenylobacterium sp.]THD65132.1 MAG: MmcQ/YjbR family DNA-binding protein [Phenylobacterium sp.]